MCTNFPTTNPSKKAKTFEKSANKYKSIETKVG